MIQKVNIYYCCWGTYGGIAKNIYSIKTMIISLTFFFMGAKLGARLTHVKNMGRTSFE
jgi:hypothetical protein